MPRRTGTGQQLYYQPARNGGRIAVDGARSAAAPEPPANVYNGMRDVFETASRAGGDILRVLGDAYRTQQRGLVDEAIVNAAGEFEAWKADYMRDNRGKDALAAQMDFTRKWAEISEKTMGNFGGEGTIFRNELKREMFKRGLYAFRDGGDWQTRQTDAWRKSVWEGRLAEFEQMVAAHPEDADRINMEMESLKQSWIASNPGLDPTAMFLELQGKAVKGRVQSFLAREDTEGARAALYGEGEGDLPAARGTIAEDHFNPLNLKYAGKRGAAKGRAAFRVFNNDGEGYRGALRQFLLYQDRDGLKTPKEMISKWAPKDDGNNLADYRRTVERNGVAWEREIDLHDPEQAAKFLKAASAHEGPLGNRYSAVEIREMLAGAPGKRGSRPGIPKGVDAGSGLALGRGIDAVEKERERERIFWENRIEAQEKRKKSEKAAMLSREIEDYTAMTRDGIMPKTRPSDAEIYEAFGDNAQKMIEQLNYQGDYAVALGMIREMSPREIAEKGKNSSRRMALAMRAKLHFIMPGNKPLLRTERLVKKILLVIWSNLIQK